ncbi:MAG: class I SAM-dependent methyltransferase [Parvularculaceae bacterium]
MAAEENAWAEYWGGAEGFEAVGGTHRHKLAEHWTAFFGHMPRLQPNSPVVVDIAAGAGVALISAIDALAQQGLFLALDYSSAAVKSACQANPSIKGVAAEGARLPFGDGCADFVISQFGIEYAGLAAFTEAARLLAPGGRYQSISHYSGGAIDLECAENERLLGVLEKTQLISAARATLDASFSRSSRRDPAPIDAALDLAFATALGTMQSAASAAPASAARATLERFLADLTRLSARRMAYAPADALGWLSGMQATLGAYLRRMQSMRAAALDTDKIRAIAKVFNTAGLTDFRAEPLRLDEHRPPAAWVIEARRPSL